MARTRVSGISAQLRYLDESNQPLAGKWIQFRETNRKASSRLPPADNTAQDTRSSGATGDNKSRTA